MASTSQSRTSSKSPKSTTAEEVVAAAQEGVDSVAERGAQAEEQIRESANRIRQQGAASLEHVKTLVNEHPIAALGVAFGVGVVVSHWLKRQA